MSYQPTDTLPVSVHQYTPNGHRAISLSNDVRVWGWCIDCDTHVRDCPDICRPEVYARYWGVTA